MKLGHIVSIALFFLTSVTVNASAPIVLTDQHDVHDVRGIYIDYLEDPGHKLSIQEIIRVPYKDQFKTGRNLEVVLNENFKSTYWIRVEVINASLKSNWVAELYDFRIENVDVYMQQKGEIKFISKGGANFPFANKLYHHKNFIYNITLNSGDTLMLYYKIKADKQVSFIGRIRSFEKLLEYSNTEYFCLALFYGIMLAMIFYNFFLFLALGDLNYLYYVLYVSSVGIYLLNNDGLGFQYVWPTHPAWNDYIFPIANYSMTLWALLYGRSFLRMSPYSGKWIMHGFTFFIVVKTILFNIWIYYHALANVLWIDTIPFLYIYAAGILSLLKGNKMARFYVLAFTLFFAGFVLSILRHFQLIMDNWFTVYSFNIGVLCEMVLLSFALADKIKMMTQEKEKGLEETVTERSNALEKKNKELDNFVYRSSHDIKGPIKSVIGLAQLGVNELNPAIAKEYFDHILIGSKKLDEIVNHLLTVIEIKELKLKISKVDLKKVLSRVVSKLHGVPESEFVKMYFHIEESMEFHSDKTIFFSAMENVLEYCLQNYDSTKERSLIKIQLKSGKENLSIRITDNGLGNNLPDSENMTEMLYNMNAGDHKAGFTLYKARIFVEKLGGSMLIKTKPNSGSLIVITLKNWSLPHEENQMPKVPGLQGPGEPHVS